MGEFLGIGFGFGDLDCENLDLVGAYLVGD